MSHHHSRPRTVCQTSIQQRLLRVERIDWDGGGSSFDVYDAATGTCLTDAESFDALPGPDELAGLLDDLCPNAFDDEHDSCQITTDGGDGWDGYCGNCADRRYDQQPG